MGIQLKLCLLIHGLGFIPSLLALGPSERSVSNVVSAHPNSPRGRSLFNQTPLCMLQRSLSVNLPASFPHAI